MGRAQCRDQSRALYFTSRHDEVEDLAARALRVAETCGATDAEISALIVLGQAAELAGDPGRAERLLERACAKRSDDLSVDLRAIFNLARLRYERGQLAAAAPIADLPNQSSRSEMNHARAWFSKQSQTFRRLVLAGMPIVRSSDPTFHRLRGLSSTIDHNRSIERARRLPAVFRLGPIQKLRHAVDLVIVAAVREGLELELKVL